ncbi:unnamed protein product [Trichogramma brassicae]|uniref:Uncharacterized protein n=1 Tax=Trichogramma brassicae TaxID=86971 RepID=A0A6H5I512_9HYME|nr:unnamed protein product [Trichogramma brassicae]
MSLCKNKCVRLLRLGPYCARHKPRPSADAQVTRPKSQVYARNYDASDEGGHTQPRGWHAQAHVRTTDYVTTHATFTRRGSRESPRTDKSATYTADQLNKYPTLYEEIPLLPSPAVMPVRVRTKKSWELFTARLVPILAPYAIQYHNQIANTNVHSYGNQTSGIVCARHKPRPSADAQVTRPKSQVYARNYDASDEGGHTQPRGWHAQAHVRTTDYVTTHATFTRRGSRESPRTDKSATYTADQLNKYPTSVYFSVEFTHTPAHVRDSQSWLHGENQRSRVDKTQIANTNVHSYGNQTSGIVCNNNTHNQHSSTPKVHMVGPPPPPPWGTILVSVLRDLVQVFFNDTNYRHRDITAHIPTHAHTHTHPASPKQCLTADTGEFSRFVFSPGVVEPVPEVERVPLKKKTRAMSSASEAVKKTPITVRAGSDRITISRSPRRGLTRLAIDGAQHSHDEVRSENHTHKRAPDAGAKAQLERMMAPEARTTLTR